ncbi:MAG: LPS export ABC transporter permease LptF [Acinetobacter populi]|uniref:LPS export ABC transporter permease LptF n=1 Tax=Acinetobacter populi TaxID=1582270 RepID=UPI002354FE2C|nr:LPS export ABC transporter permease LptF [Acinetobacter populi]MCH4247848.1 LPS export ABC transporter permease LptF [Acinetobacter populi]
MIITRYLVKQVVITSSVVVALLTLVMMGGRLIKYFGVAAQGRLDVSVLFSIIGFRLPEFLTLIVPLGFFVGLMLVFGRLYVDHEMAVLNSSGISRGQLGRKLLPLAVVILVIQMLLMMVISPWGNRQFDQLTMTQAIRSGFDLVRPKEFISSGPYTIYAGDLSEDRRSLKDIFFYQKAKEAGKPDVIILAKEAQRVVSDVGHASVVDLHQGRRYSFIPGQAKYLQAEFETYRLRLEAEDDQEIEAQRLESMTMAQLWDKRQGNPVIMSELGWRVFGGFVIILALMLAVPLSEVSPRQGRYYRLFPAIMIFASLIVAMMAVKTRMTKGELGVWAYPVVLLIYTAVAWFFARKQELAPKIKQRLARGKGSI